MTNLCRPGDIVDIPNLSGKWKRLPDDIRYDYVNAMTVCPICHEDGAGIPWKGWFSCELRGCCVALVSTGEVFVRVDDLPKDHDWIAAPLELLDKTGCKKAKK